MEYTREYEYVKGEVIRSNLVGRKIPVPPAWVRQRSCVPKRSSLACLSKEISDMYPGEVREVLVQYVRDWPLIRSAGSDLVVAGAVPMRRLQWAAGAVVNEVVMRYAPICPLTVDWFSPGGLSWLLDARTSRSDAYAPIRNQLLNRKLLYVEDPLVIGKDSEGMWFLRALYQHRYDNQLPTITSLPYSVNVHGWSAVQDILGKAIADILKENHYLAHY